MTDDATRVCGVRVRRRRSHRGRPAPPALLAAPPHPGGSSPAPGDPDCCRQGCGRAGCMQTMTSHVRQSGLCQHPSPHLNLTPSGRLSIKPGEQNRHQNVTGDRYHSGRRGKGVGACSQVFDIALAAPGDRARSVFSHGEVWGGVAARGMMLRWLWQCSRHNQRNNRGLGLAPGGCTGPAAPVGAGEMNPCD